MADNVSEETIAAIATPPGVGGIGIVRVSGPAARDIAQQLTQQTLRPRYATFVNFLDARGEPIDQGIALRFVAPHSFTGEDTVELQGHGGPVVMRLLLSRVVELGARLARPGEFTERAFLNDKLDLTQAEATADLIASVTETQARAARRSLAGAFSIQIDELKHELIDLRAYLEGALDFPDEEEDYLAEGAVAQRLEALRGQVASLLQKTSSGQVLRDGAHVVIAGAPNVGKSTLLNALAERDVAIVNPRPGTTRDVLDQVIAVGGLPIHFIDTAGIRDTLDDIEREGVRRTRATLAQADHALWICEAVPAVTEMDLPPGLSSTVVVNKIDLSGEQSGLRNDAFYLSAKTGAGLEAFKAHLASRLGASSDSEGTFTARARHREALVRVLEQLDEAGKFGSLASSELAAEALRVAQQNLSEITGAFSADDLLGEIFANFCIGK